MRIVRSIQENGAAPSFFIATLLAMLMLAGCGGGGGGNAANNPPPPPPPPPAAEEPDLTISGVVTDEPIADAEITVRIGDEEFTTTADGVGTYEIGITLIEGEFDPDALVEIYARGVGDQENVELIAIAGTVADLIAAAGDDETLTSEENPRLNVTHVSTARFLLSIDANGGTPPADLAALAAAELATDVDELIELAALIKLIVDDDLIPVPEGETIASLLRGGDGEQTVRSVIAALLTDTGLLDERGEPTGEFRTALENAIAATMADPSVRGDFDAESLLGLSVWTSATVPGWVPFLGDVVEVADDGTGVAYELGFFNQPIFDPESPLDFAEAFTWSIEDGVISVVYEDRTSTDVMFFDAQVAAELVDKYGFDQAVVDFLEANEGIFTDIIRLETTEIGEEVTLIAAAGERLQVWVVSSFEHRLDSMLTFLGWEGELPVGRSTEASSSQVLLDAESRESGVDAPAAGDTWALPIAYSIEDARLTEPTDRQLQHNVFTLLEGGTTSAGELGGDPMQWSVADDGLTLESGSDAWTYLPLDTNGDVVFAMITYRVDGEVQLRTAAWIAEDDGSGSTLAADLVRDIPLFWNSRGYNQPPAAFYLPDGRLDPELVLGWDFSDGGAATPLSTSFSRRDTCFDGAGHPCFVPGRTAWMWTTVGDNVIGIETGPTDGFLLTNRFWRVLRYVPDGRAVVVPYGFHFVDFATPPIWEPIIVPFINTLDLTDLNTWPEYYDEAQFR